MSTNPPPRTQTDWLCSVVWYVLNLLNLQSTIMGVLQEHMATIQDLKSVADQLTANNAALAAEVGTLTNAVNQLTATVGNIHSISPADQALLDQVVSEVTNAATDLATQTQALSKDQASLTAATPVAPPPPPATP